MTKQKAEYFKDTEILIPVLGKAEKQALEKKFKLSASAIGRKLDGSRGVTPQFIEAVLELATKRKRYMESLALKSKLLAA